MCSKLWKIKSKATKITLLLGVILIIMISLFSFNKQKSILPKDRFSFMPVAMQEQFIKDLEAYFQKKSGFTIDTSQGLVDGPNKMQYGLDNLAQQYFTESKYLNASDEAEKKLIADHFDNIFKGQEEEKKFLQNISDYNATKKYLAVRLYPPDYLKQIGEKNLMYRKDIEGIITTLVLDLPTTVVNLKPEDAAKWDIDTDELFRIGLENTFSKNKVEINQNEIGNKVALWAIQSDGLFATTFIYNIKNYPKLLGTYGSLIAIPNRSTLISVPIENKSIISAINPFISIASGMFQEGPGSISSNIFWYNDGKFTNLPYEIKDKQLQFSPPSEFVEFLNKLAEK